MRTLVIDIETAPNLAHVWDLWNQNIGTNQIMEPKSILCFGAKWLGDKALNFSSVEHGVGLMRDDLHSLLDEADVVVHYNGTKFDIPFINRDLLLGGYLPPSPYKQIDLYKTVRKQFNFPSNKLDYVCQELGIGRKVKHEGHELWVKCMAGDEAAWSRMQRYNLRDVRLTEKLYYKLRPWVTSHPSHATFTGEFICVACGSDKLVRQGHAYALTGRYQRYRCSNCGKWNRDTKRDQAATITAVAS